MRLLDMYEFADLTPEIQEKVIRNYKSHIMMVANDYLMKVYSRKIKNMLYRCGFPRTVIYFRGYDIDSVLAIFRPWIEHTYKYCPAEIHNKAYIMTHMKKEYESLCKEIEEAENAGKRPEVSREFAECFKKSWEYIESKPDKFITWESCLEVAVGMFNFHIYEWLVNMGNPHYCRCYLGNPEKDRCDYIMPREKMSKFTKEGKLIKISNIY